MPLKAGSAILDITPASPCHLAGYANRDHPHEGVHDPISLRALYVTNGFEEVVLVSADILWFREEIADPIHDRIAQELGISADHVMLCGTHTHSAPVTNGSNANTEYLHFLAAQTLAAVTLAKGRAAAVTLRVARGESHIGVNRREQKPGGEVVLGENSDGPIDREVILTSFLAASGKTIAEVCSFATHGTVMGGDSYQLSGDWCGLAASAIESASEGAFLFMSGGSANVNPVGRSRPSNFEIAERHAKTFTADIARTRKSYESQEADASLEGHFKQIELPRKQHNVEDGMGRTRRVRIHGLRIGPLRIVGFPGEVFSETALGVKQSAPSSAIAVNSYTTGGSAGYVAIREAFDIGGYEVRVSPYSQDAEQVLRFEFITLLSELK